jgi:hypothetical protein
LPLTILDETRSIDVIAFSFIAEELVERSAYLTSQNMKVDAYDHVVALNTTVEKKTFFNRNEWRFNNKFHYQIRN